MRNLQILFAMFTLCILGFTPARAGEPSALRNLEEIQAQATGSQEPTPPPSKPGTVLKVQVKMVLVPVRVLDHGKSVTGLRKEDFELQENGKPQQIDGFDAGDSGFNLVLVMDVSGSMGPTGRLATAIPAAQNFVDIIRSNDRCAIISFTTLSDGTRADVIQGFPEEGFPNDKSLLKRKLANLRAEGGTPLYDTLVATTKRMFGSYEGQKNAIVVLTDGEDTASQTSLEQVIDHVQTAGVLVYAIDLDDHPNKSLRQIAEASGADYFKANHLSDLRGIYETVAQQLRDTYTLSYYPDSTDQRRWRNIKVSVHRPGAQVLARKGYCPSEFCRQQMENAGGPPPKNAQEAARAMTGFVIDTSMGPSQVRPRKRIELAQDHKTILLQNGKQPKKDEDFNAKEPFCLLARSARDEGSDIVIDPKEALHIKNPQAKVQALPSSLGNETWASAIEATWRTADGSKEMFTKCFWPKELLDESSYPQMFKMLSPYLQPK